MDNVNLSNYLSGKKVLYIATKNSDYIRISQEMKLISENASECKFIVSEKKGYVKRCFDVFTKTIGVKAKDYDVVFISFMAQMIVPFFKMKFRNNTRIVDFFISMFDTLVDDRKKFKANSIVGKILHKIDDITIKNADLVVTDTKAHAKYFSEEFGMPIDKFSTLYIEADTSLYHPMTLEKPDFLKDKYTVVYFGSILPVQGIDVLLKTIDTLKDNSRLHFIMIGPISDKYVKPQSDNVTYIEWLSQPELAKYISYADICLAGHFSDTVGKADRTIPGKAYIYKAMGKRVVFGDSTANRELFEQNDDNLFVPLGDYSRLSRLLDELSR